MFEQLVPFAMPQYCERDVFGFEIVNTISNAGFLAAGFLIYLRTTGTRSRFLTYAIALLAVVGVGSGLFHALHTGLLLVLDAAPLYLFVLSMGYRALSLHTHATAAATLIAGVIAAAAVANFATADTAVYQVSRHAVIVTAFAGLGLWIRRDNRRAGNWVAVAVAFYAAALAMKYIDRPVCSSIPIGTHWLWHLLGATAAYAGLRAVMLLERAHDR